jgi:hypothetical protein
MESDQAAVVFTRKSRERILSEGGTSSWRLDSNHARRCAFAVCTRNANAREAEGLEAHQSAFLVGKVKDVVPVSNRPGRYRIQFSEYAVLNVPNVWKGDRNPVKYASMQDLGIDPSSLKWEPMPEPTEPQEPAPKVNASVNTGPLTIAEAKKGLSLTLGVPPEAIEITIRA